MSNLSVNPLQTNRELALYTTAKIDRTTSQDLLPVLLHKGIFTKYSDLPTDTQIIENERKRLGRESLTFDEKRQALTRAKEYRQDGYVIRDYGHHAVGFSCKFYLEYIQEQNDRLEEELENPQLFTEFEEKIQTALCNVRLYRLAHRLAHIILAEVYKQKKTRDLILKKDSLRKLLGYSSNQRHIYSEIEKVLKSLMFCNYIIKGYSYTSGHKKLTNKPSEEQMGWFIYNLRTTRRAYILDINDVYVGCVEHLLKDEKAPKEIRKELFRRTYYDWIPRVYALTLNEPFPVELLCLFFIRELGNSRLNTDGTKVIAFKVERYAKEANITHARASRRYHGTLDALEGVKIIEKTVPSVPELRELKPRQGLKTIIHVHMKSNAKELDKLIEEQLIEKSVGQGAF